MDRTFHTDEPRDAACVNKYDDVYGVRARREAGEDGAVTSNLDTHSTRLLVARVDCVKVRTSHMGRPAGY